MPNSTVNMFTDYDAEQRDIERRRKMADALQSQAGQPLAVDQTAGGWAIPVSPFAGMAKLLQGYNAGMATRNLNERELALSRRYQTELADTLTRAQQAGTGTPGMPEQSRIGPLNDDEGNAMPGVAAQPAVAGDRAAMARILMGHPATQAMGLQQSMQDANIARMGDAFGYGPQSPVPSGSAQGAPAGQAPQGNNPAAQAASAGIPRNIAMGLLLADPTGKLLATKIAEAHAKGIEPINVRPGGTVYVPGQGAQFTAPNNGAQTNWQKGQPQVSAVPGAATVAGQQAQAVAAGTQAGQAPYKMSTINTVGAPTLMTQQQQIEAATGQPMPQPGQPISLNSGLRAPPTPPEVQTQQNLAVIDAELAKPGITPQARAILQRERAEVAGGQPAPRTPGLRLQDQEAGAREKEYGTERGRLLAAQPQAARNLEAVNIGIDNSTKKIDELLGDKNLWKVTGPIFGRIGSLSEGGVNAESKIETLKSQIGVQVLTAMREASKTGGAVGAVTEKEWPILEAQLGALQTKQTEAEFKKGLAEVRASMERIRANAKNAFAATYPAPGVTPLNQDVPSGAPRSQTRVVKWGEL